MWPVSWALSLSGTTPETWRVELQKQDIELFLITESSMWAVVTGYTLAGLLWFWRKGAGAAHWWKDNRDASADRFHIKVHLFKCRMTSPLYRIHLLYSDMDPECYRQAFNHHKKICSRFASQIQSSDRLQFIYIPLLADVVRRDSFQEIQSAEQMFDAARERKYYVAATPDLSLFAVSCSRSLCSRFGCVCSHLLSKRKGPWALIRWR